MQPILSFLSCYGSRVLVCFIASSLQACTTYSPSSAMIGMNLTEVIDMMGKPDREIRTTDGARLEFPRGPKGKHTYFVTFDDEGKLTSWQQVLTEERFKLIKPGMPEDEVMNLIGSGKERFGLARNRGYVWSYRYQTPLCQWFQIEFTADKTVRSVGYGLPPECRPRLIGGLR